MDDRKREFLQQRQQAIHADVEALASHVENILLSLGIPTEEAVKVYGDISATGDTLLAAYTAAIDVAEEALRKSNTAAEEVAKLTKALDQSKGLAILRDHIKDFSIDIAYKMQFPSWGALADKLHYERKKAAKPTHVLLSSTLKNIHLSMKVWNEVREVADAGVQAFHQGANLDAKLVLQLLHGKVLPDHLLHTKASLQHMLQYVDGALN